jgi:acyl-CoA carboxylase epsilon subunit
VSDGSETSNSAPANDGSETNDPTPVSERETHEPHIQVLKGEPTDQELAALIAALGTVGDDTREQGEPEHNRWGLPVDKLRYPVFSWQKITLLARTHMRR